MDKLEASLAEASSPDAPPERLRALYSRDAPPKIKEALARNPSTPGALFFWLFVEYPSEVAANPALALALLKDPELLRPIELGKKFALAANPTLTEAALRLLIDGAPLRLLQLLSLRRDLSEGFLLTLADHGVDVDRLLRAPTSPRPKPAPVAIVDMPRSCNAPARLADSAPANPTRPTKPIRVTE